MLSRRFSYLGWGHCCNSRSKTRLPPGRRDRDITQDRKGMLSRTIRRREASTEGTLLREIIRSIKNSIIKKQFNVFCFCRLDAKFGCNNLCSSNLLVSGKLPIWFSWSVSRWHRRRNRPYPLLFQAFWQLCVQLSILWLVAMIRRLRKFTILAHNSKDFMSIPN